jgi:hypothetical protein
MCPDCGEPVGIPTRRPTHRDAPELPASILPGPRSIGTARPAKHSAPQASSPPPLSAPPRGIMGRWTPPKTRRAARRGGTKPAEVEIRLRRTPRWMRLYEPSSSRWTSAADLLLLRMLMLAGLAGAIAVSAGGAVHLLPDAVRGGPLSLPHGPFLVLAAMAFAFAAMYAASFIGQMVHHAVTGPPQGWQFDVSLGRAASYAARWLASIVCGPLVIAGAGLTYWLQCGRLTPVDWLILAELALLAIVLCLVLWFGSSVCGKFAIFCPVRAYKFLRHIGRRGAVVTLAASALILAVGGLAVVSLQRIQLGEAWATLGLAGCAFGGIAVVTWALSQMSRMSACKAT